MIKVAICDDDIELTSQLETIIKKFCQKPEYTYRNRYIF